MTDQEQKEFEAWAENKGMRLDRSPEPTREYVWDITESAYMGFSACLRAAAARIAELEAELEAAKESQDAE